MLKFARNVAILLAGATLVLYVILFAVLVIYQRNLLFIGGRHERAMPPPFAAQTIAERDGTRLTVWEAMDGKPGAPVAVFFYGNAGTLSDFALAGRVFHDQGYDVVLASYRGYSGNAGRPSEAGLMDDARAILDALPKDHGPVVLWGQSLGSGVAARMAAEGRASLLILQSPYTAITDVAARRFPVYPVRWFMRDRFDTLSLVPRIKVPVLIMHGTGDLTVPFDMGETLSHALAHATLVPIPGGGHNLDEALVLGIAQKWLKGVGWLKGNK
jgi:fermentation-respiration switch protein FrsA (DUF1100 family)